MKNFSKIFVCGAFTLCSVAGYSQTDEIEVAINELNGIYSGSYRFSVNSQKQLEVDFYNASGHYRNDAVYLDFLDPEMVQYNEEESSVTIRCSDVKEKCIDKEIFKLDVVRHSSRITIKESDSEQAEQTIGKFKNIIQVHLDREKELSETQGKR